MSGKSKKVPEWVRQEQKRGKRILDALYGAKPAEHSLDPYIVREYRKPARL